MQSNKQGDIRGKKKEPSLENYMGFYKNYMQVGFKLFLVGAVVYGLYELYLFFS